MTSRKYVVLAALSGALVFGLAGAAEADNNDNLADPPMACGSGPLSATGKAGPCVTEQKVVQRVAKEGTSSVDVIDFADVLTPIDAPVG